MSERDRTITDEMAALIKGMVARGDSNSDVAAFFLINQGRIAEIWNGKASTGEKFAHVKAARLADLPPPFDISPFELWLVGKWP